MKAKDLSFFENLLQKRKSQIQKNIDDALNEIEGLKDSESNDDADHASVNSDRLRDQAISSQQIKELQEIEYAAKKIQEQRYGICEMCEEKISFQRLKVKPHAKYCIICRGLVEKNN